jgi:hypothetical protein
VRLGTTRARGQTACTWPTGYAASVGSVERADVAAAVEARRELGPAYDEALVDGLLERIERRLAKRTPSSPRARFSAPPLPVTLGSLGIAIPLVGAAGGTVGLPGVIAVCLAIVLVNLIAAIRS